MTLRDQLTADLPVFVNADEFARPITVTLSGDFEGAAVACILDETEAIHDADGVTQRDAVLYVKTADLTFAPLADQRVVVGDRQAGIVKVDETEGLTTLSLRWFDS